MNRPSYFLSDIHFASPTDPRCIRARRFLRSLAGEAEAIYLVGDVFDFWLGYKSVVFSDFFPVFRVFAELVEAGTRVILFSGNHDPDPGAFLQGLGVEVFHSAQEFTIDGQRIWLEHGDTIDPRGWVRRGICSLVRASPIRRLARSFHPDFAWNLSRIYARKEEDYSEPLPDELKSVFFPAKIAEGYTAVIIGHYHRAVHQKETRAENVHHFFVLGDWVKHFTFMRYSQGQFELRRLTGDGLQSEVMPLGDHAPFDD